MLGIETKIILVKSSEVWVYIMMWYVYSEHFAKTLEYSFIVDWEEQRLTS